MRFEHIEYLALLIFSLPMLYFALNLTSSVESIFSKEMIKKVKAKGGGLSQKIRAILIIFAYIFLVVAAARPQVDNGDIKVKGESKNLVAAIDISKSMLVSDLYPNRFIFAKRKFTKLLDNLKSTKVSLIGFSSRAFLISPLTSDFNSLRFLTKNFKVGNLNLKGTSVMEALTTANELMEDSKEKAILIISDGGDKKDFNQEIAYAKDNNIKVFVYAVGTKKGSILKQNGETMLDSSGNIIILKLNVAIKELALQSGGAYMEHSLQNADMKKLASILESNIVSLSDEESIVHNRVELFYYPALLAAILLAIALFSLPRRRA